MFKRVLLSTLLGGVIAYAWLVVSWMALPYHGQHIHQFKDEQAVVTAIKGNIDKPGVYHYPYMGADKKFESKEEEKKYNDETMEKIEQGPTVFVNYSADGCSMTTQMIMGFGLNLVGALLLSLMMLFVARSGFFCRLGFVVLFAGAVGLLASVPMYIWWQFDLGFVVLDFLDYAIAWGLAGLVMAIIMKRKEAK